MILKGSLNGLAGSSGVVEGIDIMGSTDFKVPDAGKGIQK